jgi:DNA-binding GntR family transcriptional regulator
MLSMDTAERRLGRTTHPSNRVMVFEALRDAIASGEIAAGSVIKDAEIAADMGCSRTPVREALKWLEQMGVVETKPGHHTRVADVSKEAYAQLRPPLASLRALAVEDAGRHLDDDDLRTLEGWNADFGTAMREGDLAEAILIDRKLHRLMLDRVENPYLMLALEPLMIHHARLDAVYFDYSQLSLRSQTEHTLMIQAIRDGDYRLAGDIQFAHSSRASHDGNGDAGTLPRRGPTRDAPLT